MAAISRRREQSRCRIATEVIDGKQREVAHWHETKGRDDVGTPRVWQLTPSQYESYKLLKTAGQAARVEGMTPQAVRTKIRHETLKNATRLQPAFPAAVQDDGPNELPPLR